MITVNEILKSAIAQGACENASKATDWKSLAWLLFSPQGVEFCEKHNFPSLNQFQAIADENSTQHGVYIDKGVVKQDNCDIALIGDTRGEIVFDDASRVHKVIVMHGASVFIVARNYAVVRVYNIGDNKVDVHRDKTAVILR